MFAAPSKHSAIMFSNLKSSLFIAAFASSYRASPSVEAVAKKPTKVFFVSPLIMYLRHKDTSSVLLMSEVSSMMIPK